MTGNRKPGLLLAVVLVTLAAGVHAHETTYLGTVVAAEAARVSVRTVDDKGKVADTPMWFSLTPSTKVTRGDKAVSWEAAKPKVGERIVVIVAHGDEAEGGRPAKATQIKLAAS